MSSNKIALTIKEAQELVYAGSEYTVTLKVKISYSEEESRITILRCKDFYEEVEKRKETTVSDKTSSVSFLLSFPAKICFLKVSY